MCTGVELLGGVLMRPGEMLVAVMLATATAVPYGALLLWLDRNEREPWWLIVLAFSWGAVVATAYSSLVNISAVEVGMVIFEDEVVAQMTAASFSAPLVEEFTKGVALIGLLVIFRREFDNVLDGILYGALIGLGFAWYENITYYWQVSEGGFSDMFYNAFGRGVLNGVTGHPTFTALTGLGVGLIRAQGTGTARWLLFPLFLGLAIFAHFCWNTFCVLFFLPTSSDMAAHFVAWPIAVLFLQVPFASLLALVIFMGWRREHAIIQSGLARESQEYVTPADLEGLIPARRRTQRSLRCLWREGVAGWWRRLALDRALVSLAFARWHHEREGTGDLDDDPQVQHWRGRIRALKR
jgi:RsiW-degrading membrane proteinase PrsW (M82 family)